MVSDIKQVPESSPGKAGQEETEQPPAGTGTQPDVPPAERPTSEGASSSSHRQERNVRWLMSRARIWTRRGLILVLRVSRLVSIGIRQIRPGLRFLWGSLLKRWRRSLEFRTVLTTLLLAVTSFAIVGAYLSNQIANNLFQERLAQAESESRYNVKQVQDTFDGAQVTDQSSVITLVYDTLTAVEGRGSVIQRRYVFEAVPEQTKPRNRWVESRASDQLTVRVIPPELRKAVQEGGKQQFWASMEFPVGNEDRPGIAVGNKVTFNGTMYELYLISDLNTAQ